MSRAPPAATPERRLALAVAQPEVAASPAVAANVEAALAKTRSVIVPLDEPKREIVEAADAVAMPAATAPDKCEIDAKQKLPPGFYPAERLGAGEVVLTFDDGPHPSFTPHVLDLLAKHHMHATFFVVGHNISRDTYSLVQRMLAEGHTLGTHSYNHDVGMAERNFGKRSIEYIRGEHEVTRILIQIAVLAESAVDFDRMFEQVFEKKSGTYLDGTLLRTGYPTYVARFAAILATRGYTEGAVPYAVLYSRPPAGTPYLGMSDAAHRHLYDAALGELGLLNVMWNGESGDTNPTRKHELGYLTENLRFQSKRGGIILIHDYIRGDALALALARMAADKDVHVVPLEAVVHDRFGCSPTALLGALQAHRSGGARVASVRPSAH